MTHYQAPSEKWYQQPACGAPAKLTGGTWCDPESPYITCVLCLNLIRRTNE